ncbi:hypothetical protein GCM10027291_53710 [Telluribacter humicola]
MNRRAIPRIDLPRELYTLLGDILIYGQGIIIGPNSPRPVWPWDQIIQRLSPTKKDMLVGLTLTELSALVKDLSSRNKIDQAGMDVMTHVLQQIRVHSNEEV